MKILIASGIYPPDIGGPAQYARNLYETWKRQGHQVKVAAYRWERAFPPLVKHFLYFVKIIRKGWNADLILVLDNFLAAVPTMVACALMRKKYIIRTGGDLLWEWYVERTGEMILLKDFYGKEHAYSLKEKIVYSWGGAALRRAEAVIFNTEWQRNIFVKAYQLDPQCCFIVDNYYAPMQTPIEPEGRLFVAGSRSIRLKNLDLLKEAFEDAQEQIRMKGWPDIELDTGKAIYDSFVEKIRHAYAVIVPSITDICPNIIADAISAGTPFILTQETGLPDRIKAAGVTIDPLDKKSMTEAIIWMADPENRASQVRKVSSLSVNHSWDDIAREIVSISDTVKAT